MRPNCVRLSLGRVLGHLHSPELISPDKVPLSKDIVLSEIKVHLDPLATPAGRRQWRAQGKRDHAALLTYFSAPAHRPDGKRIFPSELEFFRLVADHQALAVAQRVLHFVQTDFDLQQLAAIENDNVPSWSRMPPKP
jgi:hypothetical protein